MIEEWRIEIYCKLLRLYAAMKPDTAYHIDDEVWTRQTLFDDLIGDFVTGEVSVDRMKKTMTLANRLWDMVNLTGKL